MIRLARNIHGTEAYDGRTVVTEAFLDHVAPVQVGESNDGDQPTRPDRIIGRYRSLHVTATSSFEKALYGITRPTTVVQVADDGTLVTDRNGNINRWVEIAPFVFRGSDGAETLVFKPSTEGTTHLFRASDPWSPRAAVPWYEQGRIHGPLALLSGVLAFSGVVGWSLAAGWRRYRDAESPLQTLSRGRWVTGVTAALLLSYAIITLYGITERWLYEPHRDSICCSLSRVSRLYCRSPQLESSFVRGTSNSGRSMRESISYLSQQD